ncbi:HAD family hydrolase [Rhodobacteraceae bacterium N5(2021)]|uniref:HAD family hydrolase n=1 Tax=Gymnodinialimonas phycosphaerae TaxID=2841589 RepID=A0A975TUK3_9RHOB|nr:HAD family hydrolase [Gymnodinialimonas phycosphaerae]MBY4894369.1 HAD family hydrolase [Gymnodinialimonas phycosphaerae]
MTRQDTFTINPIAGKEFVLATDLDGTFLGGDAAARQSFYSWIEAHRARVGLIFVTGRDPDHIRHLCEERGVPRPDYVVGDVGTTIASVAGNTEITPLADLETPIAQAWADTGDRVKAALADMPGLTLQPTGFRYRLSYDLNPDVFDPIAVTVIEEMGLDALISDNRFFDVLPKGISKGPTLRRLLDHLGVDERRTLVAGDTMNDLSMLTVGLPAVAVGNSEPALVQQIADAAHVYHADGPGVTGIAEAISHFRLFPAA